MRAKLNEMRSSRDANKARGGWLVLANAGRVKDGVRGQPPGDSIHAQGLRCMAVETIWRRIRRSILTLALEFQESCFSCRGIEMMTTQMGPEGFALLRPTRRPGGAGSNRGERLLGLGFHASSFDDNLADLLEEDVWPPPDEYDDHTMADENRMKFSHRNSSILSGLSVAFADPAARSHDLWRTRHRPTAASMIPYSASDARRTTPLLQQSAPVNVPDWSNIHDTTLNTSVAEDDDVDDDDRLPPHEYLAREHAAATSVLEGVGRTLKGRDLSRVRNAVWRQTGFLG